MAQRVETLAAKPNDPSLTLDTTWRKRENQFPQAVLWPLPVHACTCRVDKLKCNKERCEELITHPHNKHTWQIAEELT